MDEQAIQKNRSEPYFNGFSVLIFSGISRDKAFSVQNTLLSDFPELTPEMQYQQPMYLVKVGKFALKIEAQKTFSEVKNQFPTARIIQDRIQRKEFESIIESKIMLKEKIKSLAKAYKEEVISNRRHLHAHPELSYQEFNTASFVAEKLKEMGITNIEQKATTGWSVLIEGEILKKGDCSQSRHGCTADYRSK